MYLKKLTETKPHTGFEESLSLVQILGKRNTTVHLAKGRVINQVSSK